jgi:hypothetical protein
MRVSPRLIPSASTAVKQCLPVLRRRLGAKMQETVAKARPLTHLGEQLGDLHPGYQPVGHLSERLGGLWGVFAQSCNAQIPILDRYIG